jgi:hypothetical protein
VPDVRVTLGPLRLEGGSFGIVHQLGQGGRYDHVRVRIDQDGLTVSARVLGEESVRAGFPGVSCENGLRMETLDGSFRLLLPDGSGWRELFREDRETEWVLPNGFSGLRLEATGSAVRVGSLAVNRDVHYVWGADSPSEPQPVPSDRFFMAGDNPEISKDSRIAGFGGVSKCDLVGRVRLAWGSGRVRAPR